MTNRPLQAGITKLGLNLSESKVEAFLAYLDLLQKWNHTYNLTAITDFDDMITHHLLDSLAVAPYISGSHIVDVGSGAGLPGIPLAICYPEKQFTLIDSVGKKTRFLQHVVRTLGLKNVTVVHGRAEEYPRKNVFDTMVARAVASIEALIDIAQVLLIQNGTLLMMKSSVTPEEIQKNNLTYEKLNVPGLNADRCLLILKLMGNHA